eukprot:Gb_31759 [translate_table: standard]
MAEQQRVHPAEERTKAQQSAAPTEKNGPPSGTYVVQFPKDRIHRGPPPQGSNPGYSKPPQRRRNRCCCCLAWLLGLILLFILIIGIAGVVLYLVFRPRIPKYSVESIEIKQFNFSKDLSLSSEFDLTIRARNPNKKIGIYYEGDSRVTVLYSDIELSSGSIPAFYQGQRNTTILQASLKGSNVQFSNEIRSTLKSQQTADSVPLRIKADVPVKIKVGSVKSPKITVRVRCHLTVNKLSANEAVRIVTKSCKAKF